MKSINFSKPTGRKEGCVSSQWLSIPNNPSFIKPLVELTFDNVSISLFSPKETSETLTDVSSVTTIDFIDNDLSYWLDLDDEYKDNLRKWSDALYFNDPDESHNSSIDGMTLKPDELETKAEKRTSVYDDDNDDDDDHGFGSIFSGIALDDFEFERTKAIESMGWTPSRRHVVVRSGLAILQKSLAECNNASKSIRKHRSR